MHYYKDKSFVILNDDELSRHHHHIFSINQMNATKKQNSYKHDYKEDGFLDRVNNEIEYYKSNDLVEF